MNQSKHLRVILALVLCVAYACVMPALGENAFIRPSAGFVDAGDPLDAKEGEYVVSESTAFWASEGQVFIDTSGCRFTAVMRVNDQMFNPGRCVGTTNNMLSWEEGDVKLKYEYYSKSLKEYITLKEYADVAFEYTLTTGYSLKISEDGGLLIVDSSGQDIASASAPFVVDATGERTDLKYSIDKKKISIDFGGKEKDMQYPIIIDPSWQITATGSLATGYDFANGRKLIKDRFGAITSVYRSGNYNISMATTMDYGNSWAENVICSRSNDSSNQITPAACVDYYNDTHIIWSGVGWGGGGGSTSVMYRHYNYSTTTFDPIETIATVSGYSQRRPAIAVNTSNWVIATWDGAGVGAYPGQYDIFTIARNPDTGNWSDYYQLTDASQPQTYANVLIDTNGNAHYVWAGYQLGASNPTVENVRHRMRYVVNGTWSSVYHITDTTMTQTKPSAACDSNGNIHVAWRGRDDPADTSKYEIYYRIRYGVNGTWGDIVKVTDVDAVQQDPSVQVTLIDLTYVAWVGTGWNPDFPSTSALMYNYVDKNGNWGSITAAALTKSASTMPATLWSMYPTCHGVSEYGLVTTYINGSNTYYLFQEDGTIWPCCEGAIGADFSSNVTTGCVPTHIRFYDNSAGAPPIAWEWDFENDGIIDSTKQSPVWEFVTPGIYTVTFKVYGNCSFDSKQKDYNIAGLSDAYIWVNTTTAVEPGHILFKTPYTYAPTAWNWSFGDGEYSDANPGDPGLVHVYNTSGIYVVNLTTFTSCGQTSDYETITVYPFTTNVTEHYYFSEEDAVPVELWYLLIGLGFLFLIASVFSRYWISVASIIAMLFFAAAAFVSPVVGIFGYETVIVSSNNTTSQTIVPMVNLVGQPWMAWLLWGMALIAFINVWRGVLIYFESVGRMGDGELE